MQGEYDEAERLYSRCIEIEDKTMGPDNAPMAATLSKLAGLFLAQVIFVLLPCMYCLPVR